MAILIVGVDLKMFNFCLRSIWAKYGNEIKQIYINKDNPLLSQVFNPKNPGQDMETS